VKTRMPALMTAGTLALALTACGGGAPEEEPADAAAETPEESGGGSILDLVAGLGENTQKVDNYTLDIAMTMPDPDMGEIDMDMTYEVMDDPQASQVTVVMPFLGESLLELARLGGADPGLTAEELGTSILIIPAEGEALMSNHNGLQEVDTAWVRGVEDTDQIAPEEMFDIGALPDIAGAFAEIEQIEEVGTEEVSGVRTTLVEGTMTSEDVDALSPEQQKAVSDLMGGVESSVDASLWIADDGFPMRLDFTDEEADVSMVFSKLGETSFEIPGEDEITDK
jgi:predicted small lipoprotein YifL